MEVEASINARHSVRAYSDKPVSKALLTDLAAQAQKKARRGSIRSLGKSILQWAKQCAI